MDTKPTKPYLVMILVYLSKLDDMANLHSNGYTKMLNYFEMTLIHETVVTQTNLDMTLITCNYGNSNIPGYNFGTLVTKATITDIVIRLPLDQKTDN